VSYYLVDSQHVDVDRAPVFERRTALQLAAIGGRVGIARLLLEHGAGPNYVSVKAKQ